MKAVILAGGYGTRLGEYTELVPKPMLDVGGKPILMHIIEMLSMQGVKDFVVATGYKSDYINEYFSSYFFRYSDYTVDFSTNEFTFHNKLELDASVSFVYTGHDVLTGGRLLRLREVIGGAPFLMTYGDGLSNVNIKRLTDHHLKNQNTVTVTAVRPIARFGEIEMTADGQVTQFSEKPQASQGWINGGYMMMNSSVFDWLDGDDCVLEKGPLEGIAKAGLLGAYRHEGFWACIDTKRDLDYVNKLAAETVLPPWLSV